MTIAPSEQVPPWLSSLFFMTWLKANSDGVDMHVGQCQVCQYLLFGSEAVTMKCTLCRKAMIELAPLWMYREGRWKHGKDSGWLRIVGSPTEEVNNTPAGAPGVEKQ